MCIRETISPLSIQANLGIEPCVSNAAGFIAKIDDPSYFTLPAFSKHRIEPALRSGKDYEYYSVQKRGKKSTKAMSDSSLLHLLTLERSEFESRYMVGTNFDHIHKNNPLYFTTMESLRLFISAHNEKHRELESALKQALTEKNNELVENRNAITATYEDLPIEYQTAEVSTRASKAAITEYTETLFSPIEKSDNDKVNEQAVQRKVIAIQGRNSRWLTSTVNKKISAATPCDKIDIINQLLVDKLEEFSQLEMEQQLNSVPPYIKAKHASESAKKKAVSQYCKEMKDKVVLFDIKQPISGLLAVAEEEDIQISHEPKHRQPLTTLTTKKGEDSPFTVRDSLNEISELYNGIACLKAELETQEQQRAISEKRELISAEAFEHGLRIVDAIFEHDEAAKLLGLKGNEYEIAAVWTDEETGETCSLKADILNRVFNVMIDLKFVRTTDYEKLSRDSAALNYHIQDGFYESGFNTIMKAEDDEQLTDFLFIVVEKDAPELGAEDTKPVRVRVMRYGRQHAQRGLRLARSAIKRIKMWEAKGVYEGFKGIESLDVPQYQVRSEENLLTLIDAELDNFKKQAQEIAATTMKLDTRELEYNPLPDMNPDLVPDVIDSELVEIYNDRDALPSADELFGGINV
ncbi:PD-(D/E)XK nuclease-like domain-containing protein [Vibrio vulnificus]|nr:PD-(D/E)XK nuclease-like domain-containing protein [Vibrio vulnificus]